MRENIKRREGNTRQDKERGEERRAKAGVTR